ncbi:heme-binding protein [Paenibacillus sp. ISL-20]|uniref:heme-binding protein n=1 Tax=Paenibacillus sp. ISL-20 TaxID=2819163 RepID=UPI001BEA9A22|nr:heme-binding protein [Paenibacillus sp. ISL-20]MBT2760309.1 heme-binding protein [Paenibacillus sp. ISL-20]
MNIEQLETELILPDFTNDNALELGLIIINHAKAQNVPVGILIERNNVPIFNFLMDGTSKEYIQWLYRKKMIVDHYNKSSAFIAARFSPKEIASEVNWLISPLESQVLGGSLPLCIKNVGMVRSITVASTSGILDHEYVIEGVRQFIHLHED